MTSAAKLPAWIAANRASDALIREMQEFNAKRIVVRSETVAELHARILREQGQRWDETSQRWVNA